MGNDKIEAQHMALEMIEQKLQELMSYIKQANHKGIYIMIVLEYSNLGHIYFCIEKNANGVNFYTTNSNQYQDKSFHSEKKVTF